MTSAAGTPTETLPLRPAGAIPLLGFGTWQLQGRAAYDAVREALDAGYRHIDTATGYSNEGEVGRALKDSGVEREAVFLTTKLPPEAAGQERATIESSLRKLGVDAVDLWLIHWPPNGDAAPRVWQQLLSLRDEGLTRAAGVSNYSTAQLDELVAATGEAPAVNQIEWSPWRFDAARLAHSRENDIVLEGYSPFRASRLDDPVLREVADAHGVTPAQVILRWHLDTGVVVIPKSATPERIRANVDVNGWTLTADEVARVSALSH